MEHFIVSTVSKHGYLAIFILMTVESACIPIPSEVVMLLGGAMTAGVVISGIALHLNFVSVVLLGTLGNLLGSLIAYWVGRTGGRTAIEKWGKYVLLKHKDLDRSEAYFRRRGDVAVFISRMLPVFRTFISLPAGIAEMPLVRFSLFTFIGSLPWTLALALIGNALASNWQSLSSYSTPVSIIFAAIIAAAVVWWYIHRRQAQLKNKSTTANS